MSSVPKEAIINTSIEQIGERDSFIVLVLYEDKPPVELTSISPPNGSTGISVTSSVFISFGDELDGASGNHIKIYKNNVILSSFTISTEGNTLVLQDLLSSTASTYQIIIKKDLPFKNNRQLNKDYVFTLTTA